MITIVQQTNNGNNARVLLKHVILSRPVYSPLVIIISETIQSNRMAHS